MERYEPTREDVLIGRITDGEATPPDWEELERMAVADPEVWQRLARAQRAHARLEAVVEDAIAISELVDAPVRGLGAAVIYRIRPLAGWLAAAAVGAAWLLTVQMGGGAATQPGPGSSAPGENFARRSQPAAVTNPALVSLGPEEAWQRYERQGEASGWLVGQTPLQVVDYRELENGQAEVYYARTVVERVRASSDDMRLLMLRPNDAGHPTMVPDTSAWRVLQSGSPM